MSTTKTKMNHIRTYRESLRLTQEKFGMLIGVNQVAVSQYEQGLRRPDLDVAKRIYEVSKGELGPHEIYPDVFGPRLGGKKR